VRLPVTPLPSGGDASARTIPKRSSINREDSMTPTELRLRRLVLLDGIRRLVAQERRRVAEQWTVEDILRSEC
jgi:hypothetical protein